MLSIYIAPKVYDAEGAVARETKRFVDWVKASPPARSGDRVLLPGEIERITRAKRLSEGIPVDDATRSSLIDAAKSVGIAADDATAMIA